MLLTSSPNWRCSTFRQSSGRSVCEVFQPCDLIWCSFNRNDCLRENYSMEKMEKKFAIPFLLIKHSSQERAPSKTIKTPKRKLKPSRFGLDFMFVFCWYSNPSQSAIENATSLAEIQKLENALITGSQLPTQNPSKHHFVWILYNVFLINSCSSRRIRRDDRPARKQFLNT